MHLQGLWKALASSKIKYEGLNLNEDPVPTNLSMTANGVPLPPLSEKSNQKSRFQNSSEAMKERC